MTTTVYSGRVTNWPLIWAMNGLAVLLVAFSGVHGPDRGLIVVAAVIVVTNLTMTSVRTTAGPNGVVVRYGVLGYPRFRFAAASIERAEGIELARHQVGGWGIHWTPWRGTRLTIRSGPTLVLHLVHGGRVQISAVDAAAAADVVNRAVGERTAAAPPEQ